LLKEPGASNPVPCNYIPVYDRRVQIFQILSCNLIVKPEINQEGHSSKKKVFSQTLSGIFHPMKKKKFGIRKTVDIKLHQTTA